MADDWAYDFVPIPRRADGAPDSIIDTPVFHAGKPRDEQLVSGELRCTLTALTPLLAANYQYKAEKVVGAEPVPGDPKKCRLPPDWGNLEVARDKTVLEPLRLADGRVAIAGSALKGMLRHYLGALLAAPMERVAERTYSYRPNLAFADDGNVRREPRAAIVLEKDANSGDVLVAVLPASATVEFLTESEYAAHGNIGPFEAAGPNHFYFRYEGGIDGSGKLAKEFNKGTGMVYRHAVIHRRDRDEAGKRDNWKLIPSSVIEHYLTTQDHLSDQESGHLRPEYPLRGDRQGYDEPEKFKSEVAADIRDTSDAVWRWGTLVYVEMEYASKAQSTAGNGRIVSVGHHFRYRWRHTDTVRTRWSAEGRIRRPELRPLEKERALAIGQDDNHRSPERLSGARLLFGYAADERNEGNCDLGRGDFRLLAGRISINMAVERLSSGGASDDRFYPAGNPNKALPLAILGAPRPSAVERYLEGNDDRIADKISGLKIVLTGPLETYGDLPGCPGGQLAGRKFYAHQSAVNSVGLADAPFTPKGSNEWKKNETTHTRAERMRKEGREIIAGNQAALARFVSARGTQFRFTLRFRDLRLWELGAVLAILEPGRLREKIADTGTAPQRAALHDVPADPEEQPPYGLKLGHGRPLGLGSVRIAVDQALMLTEAVALAPDEIETKAMHSFARDILPRLDPSALGKLMGMMRYRGRGLASYAGPSSLPAVRLHSTLRQQHAKRRREFPQQR